MRLRYVRFHWSGIVDSECVECLLFMNGRRSFLCRCRCRWSLSCHLVEVTPLSTVVQSNNILHTAMDELIAENEKLKALVKSFQEKAAATTAEMGTQTSSVDRHNIPYRFVYGILVYSGKDYYGMQYQKGNTYPSIESVVLEAMFKADCIKHQHRLDFKNVWWTRSSRTDKGVHAAGNVITVKLMLNEEEDPDSSQLLKAINKELPEDIRLMCLERCVKGFDAHSFCASRQYDYILPSYAFMEKTKFDAAMANMPASTTEERDAKRQKTNEKQNGVCLPPAVLPAEITSYKVTAENNASIAAVLKKYLGNHNYANFTEFGPHQKNTDASNQRYMRDLSHEVFERNGMEFVRISIHGDSFMLHQIRRMVGLVVTITRKEDAMDTFFRGTDKDAGNVFSLTRMVVAEVPGNGLYLDRTFFPKYTGKLKSLGNSHEHYVDIKDAFASKEAEIKAFKVKHIIRHIVDDEEQTHWFGAWLISRDAVDQSQVVQYCDMKKEYQ